jgi:putative lipoprotein
MRLTGSSIFACVLALMLATACVAAAALLAGSEWRPTEIGGVEVPAGADMFVRFGGEGKLRGHGGCNGFFGTYKLTGDAIEIGKLGATRMACPAPIMDRETRFLEALANARRFARDGIDLSLIDDAGNTVVRLIQTDAD